MQREEQIRLTRRVLDHLAAGSTDRMAAACRNSVSAYTSRERLGHEVDLLFRGEPLLLGLSSLLPGPGSFLADDAAGLPVLFLRDSDGALRAFLNSCRHRGARLLDGRGDLRRGFSCPYHGWSYDLGGRLAGVPDGESFAAVDLDGCSLIELPVAEADGLIWMRAGKGTAIEPGAHLGGLAEEFASYGFGGYHHYATRTVRTRMNWKMIIDTFLEPYHFAQLHRRTVAPIFFPNLCLVDTYGRHLREFLPRRTIETLRGAPEADWDAVWHSAIVYVLFPNTVFVMQQDHAEVWRVFPEDGRVDRAVTCLDFYIPEPAETEKARRHWDANVDLTVRTVEQEDFVTGEGAHAAYMTGLVDHVTYGANEPALAYFEQTVAQAVGETLEA